MVRRNSTSCSWALRVFLLAVALSALLSFFSSTALEGTGYAVAIIVLAVFIALGIVFDMIGVAVTAADPKPFHSMAAHREKGAKEAIRLLKNANQVILPGSKDRHPQVPEEQNTYKRHDLAENAWQK